MGAGLRPGGKAPDKPPDSKAGAPVLDSTAVINAAFPSSAARMDWKTERFGGQYRRRTGHRRRGGSPIRNGSRWRLRGKRRWDAAPVWRRCWRAGHCGTGGRGRPANPRRGLCWASIGSETRTARRPSVSEDPRCDSAGGDRRASGRRDRQRDEPPQCRSIMRRTAEALSVGEGHGILRPALSANITETPATFGISVGRWR